MKNLYTIGIAAIVLTLAGLACCPLVSPSKPVVATPTLGGLVGSLTATAEAREKTPEQPTATASPTEPPQDTPTAAPEPTEMTPTEMSVTEAPPTEPPQPTQAPEETQPPEPTEAPSATPQPLGWARSNPAPVGSHVTIGDVTMWVSDVTRPADRIIADASRLNPKPGAGNEFVMMTFNVTCNRGPDEACGLAAEFELSLVGSSGLAQRPEWFISGIDGKFESGGFFGGATRSGWLAFKVRQGEADLVLAYEEFFGGGTAYLAIQ